MLLIFFDGGNILVLFTLAHNPFCVIFLDLDQSADVVDQICQRDVRFCPHHADPSEYQPARRLLHEDGHRLHSAAYFRLLATVLARLVVRLMSFLSFFCRVRTIIPPAPPLTAVRDGAGGLYFWHDGRTRGYTSRRRSLLPRGR